MKSIVFLCYFFSLQVFSCNDMESYRAILNDIKSSELFIDFVEEREMCSNLKVLGYLYSFCFIGYVFADYSDIGDNPDIYEYCFDQNRTTVNKEFKEFEKLSDNGEACLRVYITEAFNNKVAVELTPKNWRINTHLVYLYEIFPDKSVKKLEEMVLIVEW